MQSVTLDEILRLRDRYYGSARSCNDLQDKIRASYGRSRPVPPIMAGDPLDNIAYSLQTAGVCYVAISDSLQVPQKEHYFTLFSTPHGIFRLDMYTDKLGIVYPPRVVEWATYEVDLLHLNGLDSGVQRLGYWNGLFNAREVSDAVDNIVIEVNGFVFEA